MISLDGSFGEGGGQILRSALALSIATGTPFRIRGIRAGRSRPGLLRQHLTCVRAATAVSDARVVGADLGSTELSFHPQGVRAGDYEFAIGSAGSTLLVLQTVLPPLMRAPGTTTVRLEGGTHNSAAPPFEFIEDVFFHVLRSLGASVALRLERAGFHPAGGGAIVATINGSAWRDLDALEMNARDVPRLSARVLSANLPPNVAAREADVLAEHLGIPRRDILIEKVSSLGPGNAVQVRADAHSGAADVREIVTTFGERGIRAEDVARDAATAMKTYVERGAPVGEHLADQLLLPLALGAGGEFTATCASLHLTTNAWVLSHFLGDVATIDRAEGNIAHVTVRGR